MDPTVVLVMAIDDFAPRWSPPAAEVNGIRFAKMFELEGERGLAFEDEIWGGAELPEYLFGTVSKICRGFS